MYECINGVFRVLVPIYEANHDFKRLHILHSKLAEAFQTIIRQVDIVFLLIVNLTLVVILVD